MCFVEQQSRCRVPFQAARMLLLKGKEVKLALFTIIEALIFCYS